MPAAAKLTNYPFALDVVASYFAPERFFFRHQEDADREFAKFAQFGESEVAVLYRGGVIIRSYISSATHNVDFQRVGA